MTNPTAEVVICGAGIAGVAAAYYLGKKGLKDIVIVEQGDPLSLTSDKSTEAYRNWWPGPDGHMIALMNRSIELLEAIARESSNRIHLNRRGYLYATADAGKIPMLAQAALDAAQKGAGALRVHSHSHSSYRPSPAQGFDPWLEGTDLISDPTLIQQHFPYLNPGTRAVLHVRRAGWLSAQQLGMYLLEQARESGVRLVRGQVVGVDLKGGAVASVQVRRADGLTDSIHTSIFINAAGPMQKQVGQLLGVELPVFAERHLKMSFSETLGAIPREAPMLIWMDETELPWSPEERAVLAEEESTRWLLGKLPSGVHCRPDGPGASTTLLVLYNLHTEPVEPVFPLPPDPHYAEVALRGLSVMVPGLQRYFEKAPKPWIDGGYYLKTQENRPLIGPLPVKGGYIIGALSGFGVMAACAAGELLAAHVTGAALPGYAPAFLLSRYQSPAYQARLQNWGDTAQL
ncbi:NAD(P)/FAD-dependent oxidoreductase [Meiothermus hypogaeus]|uniref:FAD-dependent oxidoreductase n=2 Tax=Meiothermus hypogaeus TaxID=884155 RepID=A0A511QZG9_9DEIN|nr:FAD-binding oxidoreductase [Meiothermus hypogaeus]RIH76792.1 D-amino acid dehydrogenase [Meiothermus hypogaeus]GEM82748.1 FAD-dependent oxidoreductase [Meiothermus hypogaeus NBRC 106114]